MNMTPDDTVAPPGGAGVRAVTIVTAVEVGMETVPVPPCTVTELGTHPLVTVVRAIWSTERHPVVVLERVTGVATVARNL